MNVVAIVQARMGSSRLPGKVLQDICGQPMIERVVGRVLRARAIDQVVVATSTLDGDQPLYDYCVSRGWSCFRGDEQDVLARYYQAAQRVEADIVVRVTGDCPMVDPEVIDQVVARLIDDDRCDVVSSVWPVRTFPRGLDTEAMRMSTLAKLHEKSNLAAYREHVTLAAYRHEDMFSIGMIKNRVDQSMWRLTVDTAVDLDLVRKVFAFFKTESQFHGEPLSADHFSLVDLGLLFKRFPYWLTLNQHVRQKAA